MRFGSRFALSALAAAAALTASAGLPTPVRAAADSTMTVAAPDSTMTVAAPAGEVWSLARCIQTALEQNGDVRAARARTVQARGGSLRAWSNVLPSVTADASGARSGSRRSSRREPRPTRASKRASPNASPRARFPRRRRRTSSICPPGARRSARIRFDPARSSRNPRCGTTSSFGSSSSISNA